MGIFSIFKKRKKQIVEELSKEDLQWNKMWDLWVQWEIESPYKELMEYTGGVANGGHYCHFDNISGNSDLKRYVEQLVMILPEPLKSNVQLAYDTYKDNPDDMSEEDSAILENCDKVYYDNEELIDNILKERASKIEL